MSIRIAIIGSRDLSGSISFEDQVEIVKQQVLKLCPNGNCILVSGGSSWADFIAVILRNELPNSSLMLYLPSNFSNGKFIQTEKDKGASFILNDLHEKFKETTGMDSLNIMENVLNKDRVNCKIYPGFLNRNNYIAQNCDHLIALSHGIKEPDSSGTLYTWNKASNKSRIHIHIDK